MLTAPPPPLEPLAFLADAGVLLLDIVVGCSARAAEKTEPNGETTEEEEWSACLTDRSTN